MLLDDDVVANGKAKAGTFSGRLGREEWVEHLFFYLRWHAGAIVTDPDFYAVAKVFRRGREGRLVDFAAGQSFVPRCVNSIGNQIEQNPCDFLREDVNLSRTRIKRLLDHDIEILFLGPCPMIGKLEAFLDNCIYRYRAVFS